jgi:hypothetical protein
LEGLKENSGMAQKWSLKEEGVDVNWIHLAQDNLELRAVVNKVINISRPARRRVACFLLGSPFDPEDRGSTFLRSVSVFLQG